METEKEGLLTVREVALRLRVDETTIHRWIKSGTLEAIILPHRGKRRVYRIRRSTLEKVLNSPQSSPEHPFSKGSVGNSKL